MRQRASHAALSLAYTALLCLAAVATGCHLGDGYVVDAGFVHSAATGFGSGPGWSLGVGSKEFDGPRWRVAQTYNDQTHVFKLGYEERLFGDCVPFIWGVSGHLTESDAWGMGPTAGIGLVNGARGFVVGITFRAYAWLGSDGADFDVGIEGSTEIMLGFGW
jgi:hypothetical protein